MTPAEKILWDELRANKLGVHFLGQWVNSSAGSGIDKGKWQVNKSKSWNEKTFHDGLL